MPSLYSLRSKIEPFVSKMIAQDDPGGGGDTARIGPSPPLWVTSRKVSYRYLLLLRHSDTTPADHGMTGRDDQRPRLRYPALQAY